MVDIAAGDAGEMTALVQAFDWGATPLGPLDEWPQSLRAVVRILLTSRFAMWMGWGRDLTFLYNDAYRSATLGRKHPWALGKPARDVWAEIWPDIEPRIRKVMESGAATWDEALMLFLERNGYQEETYHTFSYSPLTNDPGDIVGMLCVVSEETERVIGERRLASLRELGSALAATGTEGAVLSAVEQALAANPRDVPFAMVYLFDDGTDLARLAAASGIGRGEPAAPEVVDAADAQLWPIREMAAGASKVTVDLDARFEALPTGAWDRAPSQARVVPIAKQGQERPAGFLVVGLNPFRMVDESYSGFVDLIAGQIAGSLANARAYEEERRRAESLAELDRAKTAFFSNVSHEFRTPLTLMLAPVEDLLADSATIDPNRERGETIHRNALRLLKLVNTMLDFTRIEAGRVRASYEPVDLAQYTAELASSFRAAIERAGLSLVVDCPPLPAPAGPVYVDRDMWEKVVLNLLSNAFKHTFTGEITVRVHAENGRALLDVRDTGVGIPAEELPHVFERFHRVPNARSRTHEGTGIGLALVQELVKLHGGAITVASTVGAGTTFTIALPFGADHLAAEHRRTSEADRRAANADAAAYVEESLRWLPPPRMGGDPDDSLPADDDSAPTNVLVADDNADMRDYVSRLLRARGWRVVAVADGREALDEARARTPDLVLSDVMMPGLDGFELLRALHDDPDTQPIPVMLLSARAGEEARVEGMEAGAADYLVKPFSARELVARVEAQLLRAGQATEERRIAAERELALAGVRAERSRLQDLFAQAPAAIAVLRGPDFIYESANAHYRHLVGGREVLGRPIREALPELEGQGIYELLNRVRTTGEPFVGTEVPVTLDVGGAGRREERFFTFVYQPIREGAEIGAVFVHAVDVTDQVRARSEAEAANRAKSEFLAAMSHELRTPLNAIGGYAQLFDMGLYGHVSPEQHEALGRVQRSQQHLLALINDVLNFAKLEAGRVEYDIADIEVGSVIDDVVHMVEPQLRAKGIGCDVRPDARLHARADREKLEQILLNLLSNAIKFTSSGGRITVDTPASDVPSDEFPIGRVFIRVSDTGCGIPRDKQDAIFDPFVQVNRRLTTSTEGTGLGLAISRDLARGMGGDLRVRSGLGEGAAFTLTLLASTS